MKLPFERFEVAGSSMIPRFKEGDKILVYTWGKIRSGDTVVFLQGGLRQIKRATQKTKTGWIVRGDNFSESTDSDDYGAVPHSQIIGKVLCKY